MDQENKLQEEYVSEPKIANELVLLIRGFFSLPVMSALGKLGALDVMLSNSVFAVDDFPSVSNKDFLRHGLHYLARLGLIDHPDAREDKWKTTELGRQIFQRASSFYVPHSYHEYMENFYNQLLAKDDGKKQNVDRLENIIGSGKTHQRYFPPAVSFLKRKVEFDLIADIGCGDGQFLDAVLKGIPGKRAVGIDLSEIAVSTTSKKLRERYPDREINMVCSDASDIKKWSELLSGIAKTDKLALSMWFLIHEISNNNPENIITFLNQIHRTFPKAALIIGEIVRQTDDLLVKSSHESIMPEYLFFHDLSKQGVLSWKEYQRILENIPYQLMSERLFDEIASSNGAQEPSSFLWCLRPE